VTFAPGGSPSSVALTDLDGDKKPDLVALNQSNGSPTLAVWFGTGVTANPFTAATPLNYGTNAASQNPQWFDVGDFNGDTKLDVVMTENNTNSIRVFLGNGTTTNTFQTPMNPIPVGISPQQLAVGDFNGDGKLDVVVCNFNSNNVSMLLGNGDGTFGSRADFTSVNLPWAVAAMDFNNDGRLDFGVTNQNNQSGSTNGNLTIYLNTSQ
jgi:hypothetical protein